MSGCFDAGVYSTDSILQRFNGKRRRGREVVAAFAVKSRKEKRRWSTVGQPSALTQSFVEDNAGRCREIEAANDR